MEWHPEDSLLYSGSGDTNIIEWDLQTGKMRRSVISVLSSHEGMLNSVRSVELILWPCLMKQYHIYSTFTSFSLKGRRSNACREIIEKMSQFIKY